MSRGGGARRKVFYSKVLCEAEIGRCSRRLFGAILANLRRKMDTSTVKAVDGNENLFFFGSSSGNLAGKGESWWAARQFEMAR